MRIPTTYTELLVHWPDLCPTKIPEGNRRHPGQWQWYYEFSRLYLTDIKTILKAKTDKGKRSALRRCQNFGSVALSAWIGGGIVFYCPLGQMVPVIEARIDSVSPSQWKMP